MRRFAILFVVILVIALVMLAGLAGRNGFSLLDPEMRMVFVSAFLIALYGAWRISGFLKGRETETGPKSADGAGARTRLAALFGPRKSAAMLAREARIAARRRALIAAGKLEPDDTPAPTDLESPEPRQPPTRAARSAKIEERMAARAERVRRAREEGKL